MEGETMMRRFDIHGQATIHRGVIGWCDPGGEGPNVSIPLPAVAWWAEDVAATTTTLHLHNGDRVTLDFTAAEDGAQAWSDFGTDLLRHFKDGGER